MIRPFKSHIYLAQMPTQGPVSESLTIFITRIQEISRRFIRLNGNLRFRAFEADKDLSFPFDPDTGRPGWPADIVAVSNLYDIPIEFSLLADGERLHECAGATSNHTIWKRLRFRRHCSGTKAPAGAGSRLRLRRLADHAALVALCPFALSARQTRYLFRVTDRLRPPKRLDVNDVAPEILTTYAGLLLRDLLDRFQGDVAKAAGAYNGGVRNPNLKYAAGVEMVRELRSTRDLASRRVEPCGCIQGAV